jgi:ATP-dependent protease Clp ATPase subunit
MAIRSAQREEQALQCSFCNKTQDAAAKLISSPGDYPRAYICEQCVRVLSNRIGEVPAPSGHCSVNAPGCSFCRKGPNVIRLLPSSGDLPEALICEECLAVCMYIIKDDASPISD